jgi:hypothetical protein
MSEKVCRKCGRVMRTASEQNKNYGYTCKVCRTAYSMNRYLEHAALIAKLKSVPCMDCDQTYPHYCMDFDHRDGSDKVREVSKMATYNKEKTLREIEKCDVVCAICHRHRTFLRQQGLWES